MGRISRPFKTTCLYLARYSLAPRPDASLAAVEAGRGAGGGNHKSAR